MQEAAPRAMGGVPARRAGRARSAARGPRRRVLCHDPARA